MATKTISELVTRRAIDQEQYHLIEEILSTDLHPIAGLSDDELDKGSCSWRYVSR